MGETLHYSPLGFLGSGFLVYDCDGTMTENLPLDRRERIVSRTLREEFLRRTSSPGDSCYLAGPKKWAHEGRMLSKTTFLRTAHMSLLHTAMSIAHVAPTYQYNYCNK
eukprot:GHVU01077373.1.p2 GENE.GHVU01077373.1~~GHVU01077373.1.p2  ORF type:complete len:108 (-),score=4.06 GHVU01077373.1:911-1234(-)